MTQLARIPLSPPHIDEHEFEAVRQEFLGSGVEPGEQVGSFEREFADVLLRVDQGPGTRDQGLVTKDYGPPSAGPLHAAGVASGTAALHLALRILPVMPGQEVFCSTFTSSATANPIRYERGVPVFIDCECTSWNMDPERLAEAFRSRAQKGALPRAVVLVHVYGQCANIDAVAALCERYGVPLIEDAAEALGATYQRAEGGGQRTDQDKKGLSSAGRPPLSEMSAGTVGKFGVFSFGENKIVSSSSGGVLVSSDGSAIAKARRLRTPEPALPSSDPHSQIGFEYQMNPILAAVGRGQLRLLEKRIEARRRNFAFYERALRDLPGISFMPEPPWSRSTRWLTCILVDHEKFGVDRDELHRAMEAQNIETRPVWMPLHRQPVFAGCDHFGGEVAEDLFARGLCLPSGSNLSQGDLERVAEAVRRACR